MQEFPDFDLSIITEEEETAPEEKKESYVPVLYVGSTTPTEGSLSPEGLIRPRKERTEEGQWVKKEFLPEASALSLRVIGYANLVYAQVLKEGINVYLAGEEPELLFSVKADAKIEPSYAGQELSVFGWSKKSVSYEPLEGEVVDTVGLFSHVYATDGERLFVIEVSRGDVPNFSTYTATMSTSAKQLWDAYAAYRKVLRETTKENFEALLNALATHPDLLEAAQKAYRNKVGGVAFDNVKVLDKEAIKEAIGPLLREKMKAQFRKWLAEQLSENPSALFAQVEEGKRLLRSGGILTGSFSPLESEVPVALTLMRTLVPVQEGIRDGVVVGSVVTVTKDGQCNVYVNSYQNKVFNLTKGREKVLQNLPKIYAFMSKYPTEAYVKKAKELESEGIKVLSPRAIVPQNVNFKVKDKIMELVNLYAGALGASLRLIEEKELNLYVERLDNVAEQYVRPKSQVENMKEQYEEAIRELQAEKKEDRKRTRSG